MVLNIQDKLVQWECLKSNMNIDGTIQIFINHSHIISCTMNTKVSFNYHSKRWLIHLSYCFRVVYGNIQHKWIIMQISLGLFLTHSNSVCSTAIKHESMDQNLNSKQKTLINGSHWWVMGCLLWLLWRIMALLKWHLNVLSCKNCSGVTLQFLTMAWHHKPC